VVLKELTDNALDAAEEAGIPPVVRVRLDGSVLEIADQGPGIPDDVITDILDFTVRVSSREAYVGPTRGAQGNALKTIVAMPFALEAVMDLRGGEAQMNGHEHCPQAVPVRRFR
jgi:DNA topoisomerase VI subunit B